MARYKKYTVAYEDTIQSIAQHETGDMDLWKEIVEYNNLSYPYIVDTLEEKLTKEGTVTIGDSLIIPIEVDLKDTNLDSLGHRDRELILGLALGRDLAMDYQESSAGNKAMYGESFGLSASREGGIKTVQGVHNLRQAVINRLLTPKGSLLLHPNYGSNLHEMMGRATSVETLTMIDNEIEATIKKDGRVESVELVNSTIETDQYYGEFTIYLYSLQEYFNLVIEAEEAGSFAIY